MRVLLTGATGFVGQHVLERLMVRSDSVRVLALPETLDQLRQHDRVEVIVGSLVDRSALVRATDGMEVVYHLAGLLPGSRPRDLTRINVAGTEDLLIAGIASRVQRVVFASTASVYRHAPWPILWPIREDFPLEADGPRHLRAYAESKIGAEHVLRRLSGRHGFEHVVLRPELVYGVGARWIEHLLAGLLARPVLAMSRAARLPKLQWVHVTDLAEAVVRAGTRAEAANHVLNVAGDELFSVWDVVALAGGSAAHPSRGGGAGSGAGQRLRYAIDEARDVLGFSPSIRLREGLREIMATLKLGRSIS